MIKFKLKSSYCEPRAVFTEQEVKGIMPDLSFHKYF